MLLQYRTTENRTKGNEVVHAKQSLQLYSDMNSGFGLFFLFSFGLFQVFIIFSVFLSISQAVGTNKSGWTKVMISCGYLVTSSGILLNIVSLTLVIDARHRSLKELAKYLQDTVLFDAVGYERQDVENTIKILKILNHCF